MARLELIVKSMVDVPMVAFTGDDEFSNRQLSFNPLWWVHHIWTRKWLKKTYNNYSLFYTSSYEQARYFNEKFGIETKFLVKVGKFDIGKLHDFSTETIKILYAGKLYCNRYKTLKLLADTIDAINSKSGKQLYELDIYSPDCENQWYRNKFSICNSTKTHERVSSSTLTDLNKEADILLHVEGLDLKNSLITKYSFSTKLIDCLSSGAATLVISRDYHSGYEYCKQNDIAFTACDKNELMEILNRISQNKYLLKETAINALKFGQTNHDKEFVQKNLFTDFTRIISDYHGGTTL